MLLVCPHCGKEHSIDEKRIPADVNMARCGSCGKPFRLRAPGRVEELPVFAGDRKKTPVTVRTGVLLGRDGAGKATTAVNLAAGLALAGFKTMLVEADPRGRVATMLGASPRAGLTEMVTGEVTADEALLRVRERLWLLAGGRSITGLKRIIDEETNDGENVMATALARMDRQYDHVVVLSSSGWDPVTVNALFYVDAVLVPVSLEATTTGGLRRFFEMVDTIARHRRGAGPVQVLPTFMDARLPGTAEVMDGLSRKYGESLCRAIRSDGRLAEAQEYGQSIYEYAPGSPGAQDYRELVRRIAADDSLFRVS